MRKYTHRVRVRKGIAPLASFDLAATFNARDVLRVTARTGGVSVERLLGRNTTPSMVRLRVAAAVIMRTRLGMSLPEIGVVLDRDHSTVVHFFRKLHAEDHVGALVARVNELLGVVSAERAA